MRSEAAPRIEAARPDPEDGTHTLANFLIFRASDSLCALLYVTSVGWRAPLAWVAVVAATGTLRFLNANSRAMALASPEVRSERYRWFTWLHMAGLGSAAFLLFTPRDMPMLTLLGLHMFGAATVAAMRLSADFRRTAVAVALVVVPASLRGIYTGAIEGALVTAMLGVAGLCVTLTLIQASRLHERMLDAQFDQRRRAEMAADAIAGAGLAKARFFASVSHDLRQPVHAIGLYMPPVDEAVRRSGDAQALRALEGIRACWGALDGLLAQLLDLTRLESGASQPRMGLVNLGDVIRRLVPQHSAAAERRGLRIVALPGARPAFADEMMVARVLSNLLDNAVKYAHPGGTIVLAVRPGQGHWRVQVRDAGPGIAQADQARVFDEFFQLGNEARDREGGYGLGLAISRRFARAMGGDVELRSRTGRGSTFTLRLQRWSGQAGDGGRGAPVAMASAPAPTPDTRAASMPPSDILLVEDDAQAAAAMGQLLASWGHRVKLARTREEALAPSAWRPVALCDLRLPGGPSGLDLALRLREAGVRVLLVTGETDASVHELATHHRLPMLAKPVAPADLAAALLPLLLPETAAA